MRTGAADLRVRRWTGRPDRRIGRLALGRGEVAGNFFLAGLLAWNTTPNQGDPLNRTFITAFIAIGILRQAAAVRGFGRKWRRTSYLVTGTRLESHRDRPAGAGTAGGYLTDLTPPAQLGPKAPLRLARVLHTSQGTFELIGLADPEHIRRQILTAQLAARSAPAGGRPPAEAPTSAPAQAP